MGAVGGNKKKKEDKVEKKKFRFGNPVSSVSKIFRKQDSDKSVRISEKDEESGESNESPTGGKSRTKTVVIAQNCSTVVHSTKDSKPHPLLRPRSLASIRVDVIEHTDDEKTEDVDKSASAPKVKPQFGLHPIELAERFPDEPVPAVLVACVEILQADIRREGIFRIPGRMTSI